MMKHASEPWQAFQPEDAAGWFIISDEQANEIGSGDGGFEEADARRIVACVNACAGIPNGNLEAGGVLDTVIKERDELLDALDALCLCIDNEGASPMDWPEYDSALLLISEAK